MFWRRISTNEMINLIKNKRINHDWEPKEPLMEELTLTEGDYIQFTDKTILIIESQFEVNTRYNIEKVKPIYWLGTPN